MAPYPIFDLDGTLLDSDEALVQPFVALGVPRAEVTFGHVVEHECARLGIAVEDYLDGYDTGAALPFPGVEALIGSLDRYAICSNKHPAAGWAELERLGWEPELALFADAFEGSKRLEPLLERLGLDPAACTFVGDTDHDRACAREAGVPFVLAGWNARASPQPGDRVAADPRDLLELLVLEG